MNRPCSGSYRIGLFEVDAEVGYYGSEAKSLLEFLFRDLPPTGKTIISRRFDIVMVGKPTKMSLWLGEMKYYFGESEYELASMLVNEIVYSCITCNCQDQAIHAGAVSVGGQSLLFPGTSGSGKSSVVAWLTANGAVYHTDELVLVGAGGTMNSFTRPLVMKTAAFDALKKLVPVDDRLVLGGNSGTMVPHRMLNGDWKPMNAKVDAIIFPKFCNNHQGTLIPISSAQSCLKLMACFVNARSHEGHGYHQVATLVRQVKSYTLTYGSYEAILPALKAGASILL